MAVTASRPPSPTGSSSEPEITLDTIIVAPRATPDKAGVHNTSSLNTEDGMSTRSKTTRNTQESDASQVAGDEYDVPPDTPQTKVHERPSRRTRTGVARPDHDDNAHSPKGVKRNRTSGSSYGGKRHASSSAVRTYGQQGKVTTPIPTGGKPDIHTIIELLGRPPIHKRREISAAKITAIDGLPEVATTEQHETSETSPSSLPPCEQAPTTSVEGAALESGDTTMFDDVNVLHLFNPDASTWTIHEPGHLAKSISNQLIGILPVLNTDHYGYVVSIPDEHIEIFFPTGEVPDDRMAEQIKESILNDYQQDVSLFEVVEAVQGARSPAHTYMHCLAWAIWRLSRSDHLRHVEQETWLRVLSTERAERASSEALKDSLTIISAASSRDAVQKQFHDLEAKIRGCFDHLHQCREVLLFLKKSAPVEPPEYISLEQDVESLLDKALGPDPGDMTPRQDIMKVILDTIENARAMNQKKHSVKSIMQSKVEGFMAQTKTVCRRLQEQRNRCEDNLLDME